LALDLEDYHPSVLLHCWLGHLTCKIVSEMTYDVSSGTLSPTTPYNGRGGGVGGEGILDRFITAWYLLIFYSAGNHGVYSDTAVFWLLRADGLHILVADGNDRLLLCILLHLQDLRSNQDRLKCPRFFPVFAEFIVKVSTCFSFTL